VYRRAGGPQGELRGERFGTQLSAVLCRAFLAMCLAELGIAEAGIRGEALAAEAECAYSWLCIAVGPPLLHPGDLPQTIRCWAAETAKPCTVPTIRMCKAVGAVYTGRAGIGACAAGAATDSPCGIPVASHYAVWLGRNTGRSRGGGQTARSRPETAGSEAARLAGVCAAAPR
jgi:hypothetical protein